MYAMDIFEGEGSFNNSSNIVDNIFYKICINENPIQVLNQEEKKKIDGRRETAWEKYLQEQELGEDKNTWPEKEARKRNKKIKRTKEETKEGPEQENQKNPAQEEDTTGSKPKIRNQENPTLNGRMSLTLNSKTKLQILDLVVTIPE